MEGFDLVLPTTWGQIAFIAAGYLVLSARRIIPSSIDMIVSWLNSKTRTFNRVDSGTTEPKNEREENVSEE